MRGGGGNRGTGGVVVAASKTGQTTISVSRAIGGIRRFIGSPHTVVLSIYKPYEKAKSYTILTEF
jgi:hypothetical protein